MAPAPSLASTISEASITASSPKFEAPQPPVSAPTPFTQPPASIPVAAPSVQPVHRAEVPALKPVDLPAGVNVLHTSIDTQSAPSPALADVGFGRRGTFGAAFKPLPSIQPTFSELKEALTPVAASSEPMPLQPTRSFDKAPQQINVNKTMSAEEIEARAKAMREQRERLAQIRKAERAQELETYKAGATAGSAAGEPVDPNKKLAVELLRRFRDDIVVESRKQ